MVGLETTTRFTRRARLLARVVIATGVLVLVGMLTVATVQVTEPGGAVAVVVDPDLLALQDVPGLPPGTSLTVGDTAARTVTVETGGTGVEAVLQVERMPIGQRVLTATPSLVTGLLAVVGAWIFARLLREVAAGRPFAPANVGRWRGLAAVVLAYTFMPPMLGSLATIVVLANLDAAGDAPVGFTILDLPVAPLLMVGALLVLAEVFRHGGGLADEVEGLV